MGCEAKCNGLGAKKKRLFREEKTLPKKKTLFL